MVKQDRARRTHELLLDAAAAEFVRHGYVGANLQRVAQEAHLTKGALYAHFTSKRLLAKALTTPFEHTWRELLGHAEQADVSPLEKLRLIADALAERLQADLRFRAGFHLASEDARAHGRLPRFARDFSGCMLRLAGEAQQQGQLAEFQDPERLGQLLLVLMYGVYYTTPECGADRLGEAVCALWRQLMRGGEGAGAAGHSLPALCGQG
ncbi:TetR family transcriptional regulator [Streptomyces sp. NPDC046727]|uniref:TetR family transcriptional regulator n=1 Tax=Streptomyces sp. NPDC046727 TaxID=3155373 RepID=UPI0033FEB395